jgi:hypothetical protein
MRLLLEWGSREPEPLLRMDVVCDLYCDHSSRVHSDSTHATGKMKPPKAARWHIMAQVRSSRVTSSKGGTNVLGSFSWPS